jgi:hypothetical protein
MPLSATPHNLPLRHNPALLRALSLAVAVLVAAASIAGLLLGPRLYPAEALRRELIGLDAAALALGLPALLLSLWLAWRGWLLGLLCWPGTLFFILYLYLIYLFALPFGPAFTLALGLAALCLYTLLGLVAAIDGEAVRQWLAGAVYERLAALSLAGQGLLILAWVVLVLGGVLAGRLADSSSAMANHYVDVLIAPAWIIGGLLLWLRRPLGYAVGLGLLLQGSLFILSAIVVALVQAALAGASIALLNLLLIIAGAVVCFIPFGLFARGVLARSTPPALRPPAASPVRAAR